VLTLEKKHEVFVKCKKAYHKFLKL